MILVKLANFSATFRFPSLKKKIISTTNNTGCGVFDDVYTAVITRAGNLYVSID